MARRITERQRLALKLEHLSDTEVHEVLDYISIMESMRRAASLPAAWEDELVSLLRRHSAGDQVTLTVQRGGADQTITVVLGSLS